MKTKEAKISDLIPDDKNLNKGNPFGESLIEKSFQKFGAGRSILLDKNNNIIAGNKSTQKFSDGGGEKVLIIETTGDTLVAVKRMDIDIDSKQGREMALADNASAKANIEWDMPVLEEIATEWEITPSEWGITVLNETEEDDFDADPPKIPITAMGDLYELNQHRILCGDSTNSDDVAKLMNGKVANLFATDPPYGVAYNDETGSGKKKKIQNDENDGKKLQSFLESVFGAWLPFLDKNAAWYIWHAQMTQGFFAAAAAAADVIIHRQIIWVKPSLIMGHGDYHWRHELCFYGWVKGNRPNWYADRKQHTIWEIGRETDKTHPTAKPVEIFARPMRHNTLINSICAEPFAGSGSQFIAAEQLNRVCYGQELDEGYCDVIVARWLKWMTGQNKPVIIKRNGTQLTDEQKDSYINAVFGEKTEKIQ